jgi:ABC-type sugar transport system ATPase subunit
MNQVEREPILQLQGISKRFGAVQALAEIAFEVYPGEVVGLAVTLDAYTRSRRELTGR